MAEFNLEVEMTARTDQLDKAFKKAQAGAEKTADKMNSAGASGASGIGKLAVAGAAVVASMAALELSAGLAGAAVSTSSATPWSTPPKKHDRPARIFSCSNTARRIYRPRWES